jgi:hypothetical protein
MAKCVKLISQFTVSILSWLVYDVRADKFTNKVDERIIRRL